MHWYQKDIRQYQERTIEVSIEVADRTLEMLSYECFILPFSEVVIYRMRVFGTHQFTIALVT